MANSLWVNITLHILWKVVSSHLFLWPTASEWHCIFCRRDSHHIFSLWPTVCEQHSSCTLCKRQSHHIFSYHDQQQVRDIPVAHSVKGSLITFFPLTNSLWVAWWHIFWHTFSAHFNSLMFTNISFKQKVSMLPYLFHVFFSRSPHLYHFPWLQVSGDAPWGILYVIHNLN